MRAFRQSMAVAIGGLIILAGCQSGQVPSGAVTPTPSMVASPVAPAAPSPPIATSPALAASPVVPASPAASPSPSPAAVASPMASPAPAVASPLPVAAASPSPVACDITLGFATMRDLIGEATVGRCMENERQIPSNGNAEQRTSNGLLVYRALDQRVLFVGATQTWINRDGAAVTRPNDERFEWEGDRQLVEALRRGGHTIFFRHGPTDPDQRDTDPDNLANCATQRNLTDAGRAQARAVGDALRTLGIPVGQLLSSPYCRAREYALLMVGSEPDLEPSLVLPDPLTEEQRARNTEALTGILAREPQPGTNKLLVAHSPNIRLAAGVDLPEEGGAAVFRHAGGAPQLVARVRPGEWPVWAQALRPR